MVGFHPHSGQFIGVVPPSAFETLWYPKQLLLMFDCLAIDLGQKGLSSEDRAIMGRSMGEISWLINSQMVTLLSGLLASNSATPTRKELQHARQTLVSSDITFERLNAKKLRDLGIDAVPLTRSNVLNHADAVADRDTVVRLTLLNFPAPSDTTPWESVEEFRRDPDARRKYSQLKKWINETATHGLKQFAVVDELRGLISDYQKHIELHKMKARLGVWEMLVTTPAEIAENLIKFKWAKAAQAPFKAAKQIITLMEDEKKIQGKDIAYIVDAWKYFST